MKFDKPLIDNDLKASSSSRRTWIEIKAENVKDSDEYVVLLAEDVD